MAFNTYTLYKSELCAYSSPYSFVLGLAYYHYFSSGKMELSEIMDIGNPKELIMDSTSRFHLEDMDEVKEWEEAGWKTFDAISDDHFHVKGSPASHHISWY